MSDSTLIVQSAVSSFNNAAISAPSFLWSALLAAPLFALVWFYGNDFLARLGIKKSMSNIALGVWCVLIFWLVIMHGNYAVLRDTMSHLPVAVAAILFVLTALATQGLRAVNPPVPRLGRWRWVVLAAVAVLVGISGAPTWWGALVQISAVTCGIIVGGRMRMQIGPILSTTLAMFTVTTVILMQPEFFRFGQLGSLSIIHKLAVLVVGVLTAAILALRNVNPRGRIHDSAFVKLKWAGRILALLCIFLFALTESVPVFLGLGVFLAMYFAMSVWHSATVPANLSEKLFALLLCAFGVMTGLHVITAFGLLLWPGTGVFRQSKFLL